MSEPLSTACSILRTVLVATTALGLIGSGAAFARVGVTSATDGDPVGKPPAEAERVLRIGIDVQANEVIRTGANDRAHLVFLDGTALTVGPNAQLTIDKFVYDPNTKTGELAVSAAKGVLRLVGGKISKTNPITVTTPSSTIGIRGGICVLDVQPGRTTSTFLFGNNMSVTGQGQTQNVTRPGSQVTTAGGSAPSAPTLVSQGALSVQIGQLEGNTSGGGSPGGGNNSQQSGNQPTNQAGGQGGPGSNTAANGGQADRGAAGLAQVNSTQGSGGPPQPPPGANGPPTGNQNNNILAQGGGANPATAPSTPVTTQTTSQSASTRVIVTNGRHLADPAYSNFNNNTLAVTPNATNNIALAATGTVTDTTTTTTTTIQSGASSTSSTTKSTNSTVLLKISDNRTISVPWIQDTMQNGFSIGSFNDSTFGVISGRGYVSSSGDFFAYVFTNTNNQKLGFIGGATTSEANMPNTGTGAYTVTNLGGTATLPFANSTIGDDADLQASKVVSALYTRFSTRNVAVVGQATPNNPSSTAFQSTLSISGIGAAQKSYLGVFIGDIFQDYNTNSTVVSGGFAATSRLGATQQIGRLTSAESTPLAGSGNAIFGSSANQMVFTPDSVSSNTTSTSGIVQSATTTRTSQASFTQPYTNLTGSDYYSVNMANKIATPSGVGDTRSNATLTGYAGGIVDQESGGNFTSRSITSSDVSITTSASNNRASATINVSKWDGSSTSASFQLGSTSGFSGANSSYIDNNNYAIRDRDPNNGFSNTTSVTSGGNTSTGTDVLSRTYIVSGTTTPITSFLTASGVTDACTCSFLTWGWWSGDIRYGANSVYNANGRDRLNLATYVAGTQSSASDVNTSQASATYKGQLIGNVNNNGSSYVAAGSYQNVWSFGSRSGAVTATFDGTTFGNGSTNTYLTSNSGSAVTFGTLSGVGGTSSAITSGTKSLSLNGAFYSGGTGNPVAGQAGSFAVTGTGNYKAAGTFAAQK